MTNEETELLRKVEKVLNEIREPDGETLVYAKVREHVCKFYSGHVNCIGCKKPETKLTECAEEYTERIIAKPAEKWTESWDEPIIREKVRLEDLPQEKAIGLYCDRCYLSDNCPMYKTASACAIEWGMDIHTLKPEKAVEAVIKIQSERVNRARAIEITDGGVPDMNTSAEIDRLRDLISLKADMESDKFSLKIEATAKNQGGSILEKFFGGGLNKPQQELPPENKTLQIEDAKFEEIPLVETPKESVKTPRISRRNKD